MEPPIQVRVLAPEPQAFDTSHQYEQTRQEIDVWFRFVRDNGMAIIHDTNMQNVYWRMDNTIGIGWDNSRGVALKEWPR